MTTEAKAKARMRGALQKQGVYVLGLNLRLRAGVPDYWLSHPQGGDGWVEVKADRELPVRLTSLRLSLRQMAWLTARAREGRRVGVLYVAGEAREARGLFRPWSADLPGDEQRRVHRGELRPLSEVWKSMLEWLCAN